GRRIQSHAPEAPLISSWRSGDDPGIATIVFGSRDAVAIAKAVELLWVDREHSVVTLQEGLHERAARDFNAHGDTLPSATGNRFESLEKAADGFAVMFYGLLQKNLALCVHDADAVCLCGPIYSHVQREFGIHGRDLLSKLPAHRSQRRPLYWRSSGANSPQDFRLRATRARRMFQSWRQANLRRGYRGTPAGRPSCL